MNRIAIEIVRGLGGLALLVFMACGGNAAGDGAVSAAPTSESTESAVERFADGVAWLAADAREGRGLGTDGLAEAGEWIAERFAEIGLEPAGSDGFLHPFPASIPDPTNPHAEGRPVEAFNVVGRLPAGGPAPLDGTIVVGAHYDHLGFGGAGSLAPDVRAVHNGADDNASGTMALIEVARGLAERRGELRRDVVFVAFSAEERGLVGSSTFVHAPPAGLAIDEVVAMLNMDMVGRLGEERLQVLGGESAEEWDEIVTPACASHGLECLLSGDGFGASDHSSFFAADIPVLHFFTGAHPQYHRPEDDAPLVDVEGAVRIVQLIESVTETLAAREAALTLVRSSDAPARQMLTGGARLGTIPDYAGPPDGRPGLLLSAVRADSPAERGGLQRGDLIVGIDDREIRGIEDFMAVLSEATPGERASVKIMRNDEPMQLEVVYGDRP
ncbi:MAG: M20/M25/M40 family metallo-hydrolase [Gemmatimonadota bacterium]